MLQAAGDLRFQQEARTALGMVGVLLLDLLEGHLAVQLLVLGDKHLAEAAPGVGSQDSVARRCLRARRPTAPGSRNGLQLDEQNE